MSVRFNFNDEVWVKITPKGHEMMKKYYEDLKMPLPERKYDFRGYTKMQLWQVAQLFGQGLYNGAEAPIEMEMEFA